VEIQYLSDWRDNLKLPGFVTLTNQSFRPITFIDTGFTMICLTLFYTIEAIYHTTLGCLWFSPAHHKQVEILTRRRKPGASSCAGRVIAME